MSKRKEVKQTVTIIVVCGNVNKKEKEPPPSWEDVIEFQNSIEQPLSVSWPHRRVSKKRAYKKWQLNASVLSRFVLFLEAGMPISAGVSKAFYEVRASEERARHALLGKTPPRNGDANIDTCRCKRD